MTLEPTEAALRAALAPYLPEDAHLEYGERGLCMRRSQVRPGGFRRAEALLSNRPVWLFDFCHGPEDLAENVHDGTRFDERYAGVRGPGGAPIFRVDHHHPVAELRADSTTPMVRRWLLALHDAGLQAVLGEVSRGRYLANHWDVDILFAHHLAAKALDRDYVDRVGGWLGGAAKRNDYVAAPPPSLQPQAGRAFYAGLGLEEAITAGDVTYEQAQTRWLPSLGIWLDDGAVSESDAAQLATWERSTREAEEATLGRIDGWAREGRLTLELEGRLVRLDAPARIDNADLYLYLRERRHQDGPRVQLLHYVSRPDGAVTYKLRAHGDVDLNPILAALNERIPGASFGGRAAAGGSLPTAARHDDVMQVLRGALGG